MHTEGGLANRGQAHPAQVDWTVPRAKIIVGSGAPWDRGPDHWLACAPCGPRGQPSSASSRLQGSCPGCIRGIYGQRAGHVNGSQKQEWQACLSGWLQILHKPLDKWHAGTVTASLLSQGQLEVSRKDALTILWAQRSQTGGADREHAWSEALCTIARETCVCGRQGEERCQGSTLYTAQETHMCGC